MFRILFFALLIPFAGNSQGRLQKFDSIFSQFQKIKTLHYYASFKGYGKNAQKVTEAEGKIAIKKMV